MKAIYKLTTGNSVNEMRIHSTSTDYLEFKSLKESELAYNQEVDELKKTYINQKNVNYSIDDVKESDQVRTRVDYITFDEDGNVDDNETVLESESFIIE